MAQMCFKCVLDASSDASTNVDESSSKVRRVGSFASTLPITTNNPNELTASPVGTGVGSSLSDMVGGFKKRTYGKNNNCWMRATQNYDIHKERGKTAKRKTLRL